MRPRLTPAAPGGTQVRATRTHGFPTATHSSPMRTQELATDTHQLPAGTHDVPTRPQNVPTRTHALPTVTHERPTRTHSRQLGTPAQPRGTQCHSRVPQRPSTTPARRGRRVPIGQRAGQGARVRIAECGTSERQPATLPLARQHAAMPQSALRNSYSATVSSTDTLKGLPQSVSPVTKRRCTPDSVNLAATSFSPPKRAISWPAGLVMTQPVSL